MPSHYVLGIDLGTSYSALSYWRAGESKITPLALKQISEPGQFCSRATLASVLYLPHVGEVQASDLRLPWETAATDNSTLRVIGEWAKKRGSELSERCVVSAKSWLCNRFVNRREAILPWQSSVSGKLSPLEASAAYLQHLKACFLHHAEQVGLALTPEDSLDVVLTVPASFDAVAQDLSLEAARLAGFKQVTLLEEPQAAFYAWIADHAHTWRDQVSAGDLVLVCDVGGGTTDFSLLSIHDRDGNLKIERLSVGEHLLLGGDNMDLALAYRLKAKLAAEGHKLDQWQFLSLVSAVRAAKEQLLGQELDAGQELNAVPIAVAARGSSLFAKTLSTQLLRSEVLETCLEGFLPLVPEDAAPEPRVGTGFQELGLQYENDAAISRHLAKFLRQSLLNSRGRTDAGSPASLTAASLGHATSAGLLMPTAILFNGGVFKAEPLRKRILEQLQQWNAGIAVKEIEGTHLDLAVSQGATYFGWSKVSGQGIRIAAGTARSYYVGLESSMMAVPGLRPEVKGYCVVPQGAKEGSALSLPDRLFGLVTGQPVQFRFFSSAVRPSDQVGAIIADAEENLEETAQLELALPAVEGGKEGELVPVNLTAEISDTGLLHLYMQHTLSQQRWKLEFSVRSQF